MKQLALHKLHEEFGASFRTYDGTVLPSIYRSTSEEYDTVRHGIGVIDLSHRGKLRLSGKEYLKFLQGMLSNDVIKLNVGNGLHATLLNVKGKMLADLYLYKLDDFVLIDLEDTIVSGIHELLLKYRLSYKAQIEDITNEYILVTLIGTSVQQFIGEFLNKQTLKMGSLGISTFRYKEIDIIVVASHRSKFESLDLYIPEVYRDVVNEILNFEFRDIKPVLIGQETYDIIRVEAGIPRYGIDIDENTIPIEAGMWDALNFEKGCYIGQEVIARIRWRGHVNRHLSLIGIEGSVLPAAKDKIYNESKEIGYITSSVFSYERNKIIALGYIRRGFNDADSAVKIISGGGELEGNVIDITD